MLTRRITLALVLAALVGGGVRTVHGQQQLGAIQGTIIDTTQGVMPGVTVTVTNTRTGGARTATTNTAGVYRVISLEPGRYTVVAELQGFRSASQADLTVSVGAVLGVNFTLSPGASRNRSRHRVPRHPDRTRRHLGGRRAEEDRRAAAGRPQRAVARCAAAGHQRHSRPAGFPGRGTGHGRDRQRGARLRQQRDHRRRQHQQRTVGWTGAARAERRSGAGVPGHRQQPVGRVRPQCGHHGQRHHQGRHQPAERQRVRVPPRSEPAREGILRAHQAGVPPQRLRRQRRWSDPEGQELLLCLSCEAVREQNPSSFLATVETKQLVDW